MTIPAPRARIARDGDKHTLFRCETPHGLAEVSLVTAHRGPALWAIKNDDIMSLYYEKSVARVSPTQLYDMILDGTSGVSKPTAKKYALLWSRESLRSQPHT
jgi:hypothetical protein